MDLQIEYGPAVEEYQRRLYQFIDHMNASCVREHQLPIEQARSTRCACADCRWVVRLSSYHQAYLMAKEFAEGQERLQSSKDLTALKEALKEALNEARRSSSRPRPAGMKPESDVHGRTTRPCDDCGKTHT